MCEEIGYCNICLKPMPLNATKCTECDSYQDIRRHIFAWTSILASLIAIVPIFSIASSLTKIANQPSANVSLSDSQCTLDRISLFAVNSGGRAAVVYDPEVHVLRGNQSTALTPRFTIADEKSKIGPGEFHRIELMLGAGQQFPSKLGSENCEITIKFKTLDANRKEPNTLEGKCPCLD